MFKTILLKSVAGGVAAGSALAMTLVAGPAMTTASPEIRNVACEINYPDSVSTTTLLSLERSTAAFGTSNIATARVSRDEAGAKKPVGRVRFILRNPDGSLRDSWMVRLSGGEASVTLPSRLPARNTYTVRARYVPPSCSIFRRSISVTRYYTVFKAHTNTQVNAPNILRGENARVHVSVGSESPITPRGRVRIVVERRAKVVAKQVLRLRAGTVDARFRKFRRGYFNVKVTYLGTPNFRRSRGEDDFRVFPN